MKIIIFYIRAVATNILLSIYLWLFEHAERVEERKIKKEINNV